MSEYEPGYYIVKFTKEREQYGSPNVTSLCIRENVAGRWCLTLDPRTFDIPCGEIVCGPLDLEEIAASTKERRTP